MLSAGGQDRLQLGPFLQQLQGSLTERRDEGDHLVGDCGLKLSIAVTSELLDERRNVVAGEGRQDCQEIGYPWLVDLIEMISRPESVTADLILRAVIVGSSS